jgi:hypothetical protein
MIDYEIVDDERKEYSLTTVVVDHYVKGSKNKTSKIF